MSNEDLFRKVSLMVEQHEGRVAHAYQDSEGYWTIGVGHLIDERKGGKLPDAIIDQLRDLDVGDKWKELCEAWPHIENLDEVRTAVLVDMAFNLGVAGLLKFKDALKAVEEKRWRDAADEMLQSKWAVQVGRRARRLSKMMRTGEWPSDISGLRDS